MLLTKLLLNLHIQNINHWLKNMRQFEFEERVGMTVTSKEYEAIEMVYLFSDLDKDEFCKMWVKMNRNRVHEAKDRARKVRKENADRERLWDIREKLDRDFDKLAADVLGSRDKAFLEGKGFKFEEIRYCQRWFKTVSSLRYEIGCYLGIA